MSILNGLGYDPEGMFPIAHKPLHEWEYNHDWALNVGKWKFLHVTVGLPRSGKSWWSKMQGVPIVNPDSIRMALHGHVFLAEREAEVWQIAQLMVKSLFLAGHQRVILDATNVTPERRANWYSDQWAIMYHVFPTAKEICLARADEEGREDLFPVIDKMAGLFQYPDSDEIEYGCFVYKLRK